MPKLDPGADPALDVERSFNSVQLVPLNTSVFPVAGGVPPKTKPLVLFAPVAAKLYLAVFKSPVSVQAVPSQVSVFAELPGS